MSYPPHVICSTARSSGAQCEDPPRVLCSDARWSMAWSWACLVAAAASRRAKTPGSCSGVSSSRAVTVTPPSPALPESPSPGQPRSSRQTTRPCRPAAHATSQPPARERQPASRPASRPAFSMSPRSLSSLRLSSLSPSSLSHHRSRCPSSATARGHEESAVRKCVIRVWFLTASPHPPPAPPESVLASLSVLHPSPCRFRLHPSPCSLRSTLHPILLSATTSRHGH